MVDALAAALTMREVRAVNIVLMGAASHFLPLPGDVYEEALKVRLPSILVAVNVQAFRAGRALLQPA
jgi:Pyruvate/2-oxoacid:ferredoxin oxidoreductase gamma subunit